MPTRYEVWYGRDQPPVERREVRAGPLAAVLEGTDVRWASVGGVEVVRRLFAAVRDRNWDTIPAVIADYSLDVAPDSFRLHVSATNTSDDIDFSWSGQASGSKTGALSYELEGVANRAFRYCRIGLCVLHPTEPFLGRPYRARIETGTVSGTLPDLIGRQEVKDGVEVPLFPPFDELEVKLADGLIVTHRFAGDLFEMEDQRNWTDASFKTYSTPLALGYPHEASAGQRFYQSVVVEPLSTRRPVPTRRAQEVTVALGESAASSIPRIGVGVAAEEATPSTRQTELLKACRLDHLRLDLDLTGDAWSELLARGAAEAQALDAGLELAVFAGDDRSSQLAALAGALPAAPRVSRILLHDVREPVTPVSLLESGRSFFPGHVIAAATNAYFAQMNAFRPSPGRYDGVSYPITPQVHAFDEASLVESLATQAETVHTARSFARDAAIFVSPITLLPRFNPDATEPAPPPSPDELPANVDPRQMSLFGAAWTLGSLKYLSESGASAVTYYEATGWRGLLGSESELPTAPDRFPSEPGQVFPLYHVIRDVAGFDGASVVRSRSSDPLRCDALVLRTPDWEVVMVANFTERPVSVGLSWLDGRAVDARFLDESTVNEAGADPEAFHRARERAVVDRGLHIAPYGVARVDVTFASS